MKLNDMEWENIEGTKFSILHNGSGEIFIRYENNLQLRFTPDGTQFTITDWDTPGKLSLNGKVQVR